MDNETEKIASFYDGVGRELFHKIAQDLGGTVDDASDAEFGTGGKLKLTQLVSKLMKKKGKKVKK